jgi:carbonic anhydrase
LLAATFFHLSHLSPGEQHGADLDSHEVVTDGPEHWGTLDPAFSDCGDGQAQSPIDIVTADVVDQELPDLGSEYAVTPLDIVNNGRTVQVNVAPGSRLSIGEDVYELAQFHAHSPSEHTLDGAHAEMELHLVHANAAGQLAVIGVLLRSGAEHPGLAAIWEDLPREEGASARDSGAQMDGAWLIPANPRFYRYEGSLTTPPCSEGVRWFVLDEQLEVSDEQLAAFREVIPANNRPVQPLHERVVRQRTHR